jgi:hypothetical protein
MPIVAPAATVGIAGTAVGTGPVGEPGGAGWIVGLAPTLGTGVGDGVAEPFKLPLEGPMVKSRKIPRAMTRTKAMRTPSRRRKSDKIG